MKATVSEKGQVTIPKVLRQRLGIRAGEALDFAEERGQLVARKVTQQDPLDAAYGVLAEVGLSTEAVLRDLRGLEGTQGAGGPD